MIFFFHARYENFIDYLILIYTRFLLIFQVFFPTSKHYLVQSEQNKN